VNRTQSHVVQRFPVNMPQIRISEVLRGILTKNPDISILLESLNARAMEWSLFFAMSYVRSLATTYRIMS